MFKKTICIFSILMLILFGTAFAHGHGHGGNNGNGHGYDNGPGMGPGNGNGYGHRGGDEPGPGPAPNTEIGWAVAGQDQTQIQGDWTSVHQGWFSGHSIAIGGGLQMQETGAAAGGGFANTNQQQIQGDAYYDTDTPHFNPPGVTNWSEVSGHSTMMQEQSGSVMGWGLYGSENFTAQGSITTTNHHTTSHGGEMEAGMVQGSVTGTEGFALGFAGVESYTYSSQSDHYLTINEAPDGDYQAVYGGASQTVQTSGGAAFMGAYSASAVAVQGGHTELNQNDGPMNVQNSSQSAGSLAIVSAESCGLAGSSAAVSQTQTHGYGQVMISDGGTSVQSQSGSVTTGTYTNTWNGHGGQVD